VYLLSVSVFLFTSLCLYHLDYLQRFAAVIMRIRDPRTTALIFSSGKMVCTGAKRYICVWGCVLTAYANMYMCIYSEDLSRLAARKYARVIQKLGFPVSAHVM